MDSVLLMPGDEVRDLVESLKEVVITLRTQSKNREKEFIGNDEFMAMMGISKRTAQSWRDEGIIAFSQVGSKIWYSMADIAKLMQQHRRDDFGNDKSVRNKIANK